MNKEQILELLQTKLNEHKNELTQTDLSATAIQTRLKAAVVDLKNKKPEAVIEAQKLGILKDKANFHKTCVLLLEQILNEVK